MQDIVYINTNYTGLSLYSTFLDFSIILCLQEQQHWENHMHPNSLLPLSGLHNKMSPLFVNDAWQNLPMEEDESSFLRAGQHFQWIPKKRAHRPIGVYFSSPSVHWTMALAWKNMAYIALY